MVSRTTGDINAVCRRIFKDVSDAIISQDITKYCPAIYDGVMCWPPALPETTVHLSCPESFDGTIYNALSNATRYCDARGVWSARTDYSACLLATDDDGGGGVGGAGGGASGRAAGSGSAARGAGVRRGDAGSEQSTLYLQAIFCTGYCFSLLSLLIALLIFLRFKPLHCLRNYIHAHLMMTLVIRAVAWLTLYSTTDISTQAVVYLYNATTSIQAWASVAMLCWMFIEGAYLLKIVYWTYGLHHIRLWHYALCGWGVPALLVLIWTTINVIKNPTKRWIEEKHNFYILSLPSLVILSLNAIVLISILYALIFRLKTPKNASPMTQQNGLEETNNSSVVLTLRKRRSTGQLAHRTSTNRPRFRLSTRLNSAESMRSLKACLMLIPLLGIPQVIFIVPYHSSVVHVFTYINAIVTSTQGFFVALIYCFLNEGVRLLLRNSFQQLLLKKHLCRQRQSVEFPRRARPRATLETSGGCTSAFVVSVGNAANNTNGNASPNPAANKSPAPK